MAGVWRGRPLAPRPPFRARLARLPGTLGLSGHTVNYYFADRRRLMLGESGADAVLNIAGGSITLAGITIAELTANDFAIV